MRTSSSVFSISLCTPFSFTFSSTALHPSPSTSTQQDSYRLSWGGSHCCYSRVSLDSASQSLLWRLSLEGRWLVKVLVWSSAPGEEQGGGGQVQLHPSFALWIWNLTTLHWEASLSSLHHCRSLSHGSSTERQTRSLLGGGSRWKHRPSGLSFFTALSWMTSLALNFVPGPSVDLALSIWKLIHLWEGGDKEKPKSRTSWDKSEICLFFFLYNFHPK